MSPSFKDFLKNLGKFAAFAFVLLIGIVMIIGFMPLYPTEMWTSKGARGMGVPVVPVPIIGLIGVILIRKELLRTFREWKRLGYPTRNHRSTDK